jgi:hypothetical protein
LSAHPSREPSPLSRLTPRSVPSGGTDFFESTTVFVTSIVLALLFLLVVTRRIAPYEYCPSPDDLNCVPCPGNFSWDSDRGCTCESREIVNGYCISHLNKNGYSLYKESNLPEIIAQLERKSIDDIFSDTVYRGDKENLMAFQQAVELCGPWGVDKNGRIYRKVDPIAADLVVLIPFAISCLVAMISFVYRCSR